MGSSFSSGRARRNGLPGPYSLGDPVRKVDPGCLQFEPTAAIFAEGMERGRRFRVAQE